MYDLIRQIGDATASFVFFYPLFMSYLWMAGALFYHFRHERRDKLDVASPPKLEEYPRVSILIPCFNEEDNVIEILKPLMNLAYPNYDVIAINDGSTDRTGEMLEKMLKVYPRLRVVHLAQNQGKAVGLNTAALMTRSEYVMCIDGDAILDPHAIDWMMLHFQSPRVGAVTGNPRVRTRSTLLGRIQVGEFSSIIGLIKRAQRTYGRLFTVSGVVTCFRKRALHDVGYWNPAALTEDVDISWRLQTRHWDTRFEPRALCWILMPETLNGLWKQRLRWAIGGTQVVLSNAPTLLDWKQRRMWPVFVEFATSMVWAYLMAGLIVLWFLGTVLGLAVPYHVPTLIPQWTGVIIGTTCLIQVGISLWMDSRYDRGLGRQYYWMIWYPLVYWLINVATSVVAFPKAINRLRGERARWVSPDRGLRPTS